MGYILAVSHFLTQFINVSWHTRVYNGKQTKFFREECFENVEKKKPYVSTKVLLEKNSENKNNKKLKTVKTFIVFGGL